MPSNRIIKRTALCTKYNFDIWGYSTGNPKFLGLTHRLYLSPRFMLEVEQGLWKYMPYPNISKHPLKYKFTHWYWKSWRSNTQRVLTYQDPYPAFDRPKNMTQVLHKRSLTNFLILKNRRLRLYLGFKKEYLYRKFIANARRINGITHSDAITRILESRLVNILLRGGFAKNAEIAQLLIINGYTRVNNQVIVNPEHIVRLSDVVHLKLPKYFFTSVDVQNLIFGFQRVSIPRYFLINWKLLSIRFVQKPTMRHFTHVQFNLKPNEIAFFYGAI